MANDINDILGINLPKEEPNSKSKIISDLLQNIVFSLGQGYSAQGGARGPQVRSAGIGAALQGPMVLQQIRQKQQQDQQEQAITLAKTRELLRQGRNEDAMALVKAKWGTPTAMTSAAPEPFVQGDPESGFSLQSRGEAQYAPIEPAQYELSSGQKVPIPIMNQNQMMQQQAATLRQQKGIEAEFAPKPPNYSALAGVIRANPTLLSQIPENVRAAILPQLGAGFQLPKETPNLQPDVVTVDGKGPVAVFRDPKGNYVDATTKQPITGKIGVYQKPEKAEAPSELPSLEDITSTTGIGNKYIDISKWSVPKTKDAITLAAGKVKIPTVTAADAKQLNNLDAARSDADYMMSQLDSKLGKTPEGRIVSGLNNVIGKYAQNDDILGAVGTFKSAAIRQILALGATGRVNQKLVEVAIQNDIPQITDTVGTARKRVNDLKTFFDDAEKAILKPKPAAAKNPYK